MWGGMRGFPAAEYAALRVQPVSVWVGPSAASVRGAAATAENDVSRGNSATPWRETLASQKN